MNTKPKPEITTIHLFLLGINKEKTPPMVENNKVRNIPNGRLSNGLKIREIPSQTTTLTEKVSKNLFLNLCLPLSMFNTHNASLMGQN